MCTAKAVMGTINKPIPVKIPLVFLDILFSVLVVEIKNYCVFGPPKKHT